MKQFFVYIIFFITLLGSAANSWSSDWLPLLRENIEDGNLEKAYGLLSQNLELAKDEFESRDFHFALGRISLDLGWLEKSKKHFLKINDSKSLYKNWSNFYLGAIARKQNKEKTAKGKFLPLAHRKKPIRLKRDARYELALTAIQDKKWKEARRHLYYLERRLRGSEKYTEILWNLILAEKKSRRLWKACRWARRLYSKYPSEPRIQDWGIDLQKNLHEGKRLNCIATLKDQKRRIQRLQWAGESVKARAEIDRLRSRARGSTKVFADKLLARFLLREGYVEESLRILLSHYESEKKSFEYLNLLAKNSLYLGDYSSAVAIYKKAYNLSPRSKKGRKALFQAAFASYQQRDYDGAEEIFLTFQKKYRRSGLSRDAAWHVAWINYLKGNYEESESRFAKILRKKKRSRRRWRSISKEKIEYWLAMSQLKSGKQKKATELLKSLSQQKFESYYGLLAFQQVQNMKLGEIQLRGLAGEISFETANDEKLQAEENVEEKELNEESEATLAQEESELEEEIESSEKEEVVSFKSYKLTQHFDRAKSFIRMGFYEDALWELYEIERRTRKKEHLQALAKAYEEINAFHRSARIGSTNFKKDRKKYGIDGVKYLWELAYPQAYSDHVGKASQAFSVSPSFIWSITRAESYFRKDAVSVVGAKGLMQLMPYTARHVNHLLNKDLGESEKQENVFDVAQLSKPQVNIRYGARYLKRLSDQLEGKLPLVAASYNAGPHRVARWTSNFSNLKMDEFVEHIPFYETRNYVKKVMKNYYIYSHLYKDEMAKDFQFLLRPVAVKSDIKSFVKEDWSDIY